MLTVDKVAKNDYIIPLYTTPGVAGINMVILAEDILEFGLIIRTFYYVY